MQEEMDRNCPTSQFKKSDRMSHPRRVLIVEDDLLVQTLMRGYLELQGLDVTAVSTGAAALREIRNGRYGIVLLDMGLPDEEGVVIARRIASCSDVPIVFVTSKADEESRIVGLEIGAEDYISKPFHPKELNLRIQNILRRSAAVGRRDEQKSFAQLGSWKVDTQRRRVWRDDGTIAELTRAELEVLIALIRANGRVLNRNQLLDVISSDSDKSSDRVIDVLVSRIRKKLNVDLERHDLILTVPGVGYRANDDLISRI